MNLLAAIGNIGGDATTKYLADGTPICNFSFALTSGYGAKAVTSWLNCSLFGKRAETLAPMLLKGTRIGITGELTNREYTDKAGEKKYSLECRVNDVTLLGTRQPASHEAQTDEPKSGFDDFDSVPF